MLEQLPRVQLAAGLDKHLQGQFMQLVPATNQLLIVALEKITEMGQVDDLKAVFLDFLSDLPYVAGP